MKSADFSIGTIIYILIVVIATIVSAAKKKTKKTIVDEGEQQNKPVKTWEEILAETLDIPVTAENSPGPEPVMQQAEVQYNNKKQDKEIQGNKQPKSDLSDRIYTFAHKEYHSIDMIKESEIYKVDEDIRHASIDFDIRKAVIFSEILNKKYS